MLPEKLMSESLTGITNSNIQIPNIYFKVLFINIMQINSVCYNSDLI